MRIFGLAACVIALPLVAQQQQTITCASTSGQQQVCNADTRNGVLLTRETSNNVCRQGDTWSYDRRGITVSGGCAAQFLVMSRGRGNYGNNGYGNNGYGNNGGNGYNGDGSNGGYNGNGSNYNNGNNAGNGRLSLPNGTQLPVRIDQSVRVGQLQRGTLLSGTLNNDVTTNGGVVPAGSRVQMKVYSSAGQPVDLRLDSITVNGQNYTLQSNPVTAGGDQQSSGGLGGFLNALSGGSVLQSGTVLNFTLTADAR